MINKYLTLSGQIAAVSLSETTIINYQKIGIMYQIYLLKQEEIPSKKYHRQKKNRICHQQYCLE